MMMVKIFPVTPTTWNNAKNSHEAWKFTCTYPPSFSWIAQKSKRFLKKQTKSSKNYNLQQDRFAGTCLRILHASRTWTICPLQGPKTREAEWNHEFTDKNIYPCRINDWHKPEITVQKRIRCIPDASFFPVVLRQLSQTHCPKQCSPLESSSWIHARYVSVQHNV